LKDIEKLTEDALKGDKRSIARLLTVVENGGPEARDAIAILYPETGKTHIIGITGSPGVGKSTLIEKMIREIRKRDKTVGVVAVDPTSPFSGGAFLGDRVRMQSLSTDEGVFIRSMATRGSLGGVARATNDAVKVLDASGMDFIIVETVGAGQSEVEIMRITETVVVMLSPGAGDDIQALKAGIMEIGDIFVVNKADLENAQRVVMDVKNTLSMKEPEEGWRTPIIKTVATTGAGVDELLETIIRHREHLNSSGASEQRKRRVEDEVVSAIREKAADYVIDSLRGSNQLAETIERVMNLEKDPYTAVDELLSTLRIRPKGGRMDDPGLERGLTQVYTGDGKGKTSAAFGLALRAVGRGLRVFVIQFIKGGVDYGELHVVGDLPRFDLVAYGRGQFIDKESPDEEDIAQARRALEHAREILGEGEHDVVILDEVNVAITFGLVSVEDVLTLIREKPGNVELVLTGRGAPDEIIEAADLVTEMREIKHPFNAGVKARKGIEY
jgi:LAO/AO transport system kinase